MKIKTLWKKTEGPFKCPDCEKEHYYVSRYYIIPLCEICEHNRIQAEMDE